MNKYIILMIVLIMNHHSFADEQRISNIITPVSYFVDHVKQLTSIKNNLNKYRKSSLVGISGIGKTQLARTYAYENKDNYNIIWFFDCNLDINGEFLKLAKQLNKIFKANISEDTGLAKKEAMVYLTNQDKFLLVFDNLKINENKKVQDLIDWECNGNIIFCSQDKEMLPYIVEIINFNNDHTATLIDNILESKDQEEVKFLAEVFHGYPILIVQGTQLSNHIKGLDRKEYKKKIYSSADKIKLNIELAIKELTPSASQLLNKIALINNQAFSKDLLKIITNNPNNLDDDIYQISKFVLISNIDSEEKNPVFEMHDVIANKIIEINGDKSGGNNKTYLEEIIDRLINYAPKSVVEGRIFRSSKTISENFKIILRHTEKYNINIYKIMGLRIQLIVQYVNSLDYYNAEQQVEWFDINDREEKFKLWQMNNDEKNRYAAYLGLIGGYYKNKYSAWTTAKFYYERAKKVFDDVNGYESFKFNVFLCLAVTNSVLGQIEEVEKNIKVLETMITKNLVAKTDLATLPYAKARLFLIQGKYNESLEQVNKCIETLIKNGLHTHDLFLTNPRILKTEILNAIGKYHEAYVQAEQLYNMHKPVKREDHEVFGRIYTQMARSELGHGVIDKALEHVTKAIAIFLADEQRNPKEADYSEDPDLASSYVVQGDIFFVQNNLKRAIESYKKAQIIYFYLYRDRSKNVAHVSYLYTQGAKAACKEKDLYNYKSFGKPQVKEFGIDHLNSISMFEYCKQYDMDLWAKEN